MTLVAVFVRKQVVLRVMHPLVAVVRSVKTPSFETATAGILMYFIVRPFVFVSRKSHLLACNHNSVIVSWRQGA